MNAAVKKVVDEKSKDGVFVFHDPKLDADLNLVFERSRSCAAWTGYGWFANVIFHDKDEPKKQYAIDFWFKPDGDRSQAHGHPRAEGAEAGRRRLRHDHAHAGRVVVAPRAGASGRHGGDARLAGDERDPHLHRRPIRTSTATST